MLVPTVRVAHPADPSSFMTINVQDYDARHTLWPVQAEDFDAASIALPPETLDPSVRDKAAALMVEIVKARLEMIGVNWAQLSGADRLAAVLDADADASELLAIGQVRRLGSSSELTEVHAPLTVAKGPRGLWYVMRGEARVSRGFAEQAEAASEAAGMAEQATA